MPLFLAIAIAATWEATNARLPSRFERLLRRLIVTPDLHRVRHSAIAQETASNFGSILPWWDPLFGSHRDQPEAGREDMRIWSR